MNPQSAAIAGSGNPLKSRFESEIRAKIFSKSADPFVYPPPSKSLKNSSVFYRKMNNPLEPKICVKKKKVFRCCNTSWKLRKIDSFLVWILVTSCENPQSSFSSTVTLDHFWKCMLNSIRNVKFIKMRKLTMFITAVCVLFFIKLRWPKNKSL